MDGRGKKEIKKERKRDLEKERQRKSCFLNFLKLAMTMGTAHIYVIQSKLIDCNPEKVNRTNLKQTVDCLNLSSMFKNTFLFIKTAVF